MYDCINWIACPVIGKFIITYFKARIISDCKANHFESVFSGNIFFSGFMRRNPWWYKYDLIELQLWHNGFCKVYMTVMYWIEASSEDTDFQAGLLLKFNIDDRLFWITFEQDKTTSYNLNNFWICFFCKLTAASRAV